MPPQDTTTPECLELLASLDDTEKPHFKEIVKEAGEKIRVEEDRTNKKNISFEAIQQII